MLGIRFVTLPHTDAVNWEKKIPQPPNCPADKAKPPDKIRLVLRRMNRNGIVTLWGEIIWYDSKK